MATILEDTKTHDSETTTISDYAFFNGTNLNELIIPDTITDNGDITFFSQPKAEEESSTPSPNIPPAA